MNYTRQFSSPQYANAKSADDRFYLVAEQGKSFRWPYAGWNRDGKDVTKADDLAGALAAFGLVSYAPPAPPQPSAEILALRREYLDCTAALCAMAGREYTGKLLNDDYKAAMLAADAAVTTVQGSNTLNTLKTTLVYCAEVLGRQEGERWWDNITGL